ncbi:MAG TPA: ribonuclease domain-containing protein [Nitrospira sp.]|nr:ribonuclease domain-containing protein [Nitrospira sp.]
MPCRWTIGIVVLCSLSAVVSFGSRSEGPWSQTAEPAAAGRLLSSPVTGKQGPTGSRQPIEQVAPPKAYDLLAQIQQRDGRPLAGYIGGRTFQNRERRLPRGRYREYDVNRKTPGRPRDAERIVIEQETGKAYYTGDHYRSFIPLN